jgi:hypothetical protein
LRNKSSEVSVKQNLKLTQKFENCVLDTKLVRYVLEYKLYVIQRTDKMKLMNLVVNCDIGAGTFNYKLEGKSWSLRS